MWREVRFNASCLFYFHREKEKSIKQLLNAIKELLSAFYTLRKFNFYKKRLRVRKTLAFAIGPGHRPSFSEQKDRRCVHVI